MDGFVRKVWKYNVVEEMNMIRQLSTSCGYASIDTEFPGTVFKPKQPVGTMTPVDHYALMKKNVDATNIIQLSLTLSDSTCRYTWEFNFRDFDLHDPVSIALLKNQGIDFSRNKREGIDGGAFGDLLCSISVLVGPRLRYRAWITFHGLYDLGFLIKILTGRPLPADAARFITMVKWFLGDSVFDLKPIAHGMRVYGGLEKVVKAVGLERSGHPNSLVTMHVFIRLVMNRWCTHQMLVHYSYLLYGLTWLPSMPRISLPLTST